MYKDRFSILLRFLSYSLLFFAHATVAFSETAELSWDANIESDLSGYNVYVGTSQGSYDLPIDVGDTTAHMVTGLGTGTYYFTITAYNSGGLESGFSNEVSKTFGVSDTTLPVISNVATTNIAATSAVVTWTTDEPATSVVTYNTTSIISVPDLVTNHSLTLTGLQAGTTYSVMVESTDGAGNTATGNPITFTTSPLIDVVAPWITDIRISDITATSAVFSWTTTESATSAVIDIISTRALVSSDEMVTRHALTLTGLQAGTTYPFSAVQSRDAAGTTTAAPVPFTTLPLPDGTPPVISSIWVDNITATSVVVSWTTDEPATSQVVYGVTSLSSDTLVTSHTLTLTDLQAGTTYSVMVESTDGAGNTATGTSTPFTTLPPPDVVAPVISGVVVSSITTTGAGVVWTTNEAATSEVVDGNGAVLASSASLVTSHSLTLTGLQAGTPYSIAVRSSDAAGNTATGSTIPFSTLPPPDVTPPTVSSVLVGGITTTGAVVTWTTNESATSEVVDGTGAILASSASLVTSHSLTLANLQAGTTYSIAVRSSDAAGNTATGSAIAFTTLTDGPAKEEQAISGLTVKKIHRTKASVSWTTQLPAMSQIEYGTTTAYGKLSPRTSTYATSHKVSLSSLSSTAVYHFRVHLWDEQGNLYTSEDQTFSLSARTRARIHTRTKAGR
jgi:hypothetical protein